MATLDLGKIKQVWRGTWSSSPNPAYSVDDLVEYTDGGVTSTYIAVSTPGSQVPSSSGSVQSNWNLVAKGVVDPIPTQSSSTAGKVLKSDGSSVSWGDGGGWTVIAKGTGPSTEASSVSVDNCFSNDYKHYMIKAALAASTWGRIYFINADGTTNTAAGYYLTGRYTRRNNSGTQDGVFGEHNHVGATTHWWDGTSTSPAMYNMHFYDPYNSNYKTFFYGHSGWMDGSGYLYDQSFAGGYDSASRVRGIIFDRGSSGSGGFSATTFNYVILGFN